MLLLLFSACLLPPSDKDSPDEEWNPFDDTDGDSGDVGDEDSGAGGGGGGGARDNDGDGYDATRDCDDSNPAVHPDGAEICNGLDENCDGQIDEGVSTYFYADADGDGFGDIGTPVEACDAPAGYVVNANDCDDRSATTYPGAVETCDGQDEDCDGVVDEAC